MNFAFLIHSRDYTDVQRKFKIAKYLPKSWVEFWCLHWPPIVVSTVTGFKSQKTGEENKGWLIAIPMTAKQMMENREMAKRKIVKAIKKAEKLGAGIVGLGALTSSVTNGGLDIADKAGVLITTGNSLTAGIAVKHTQEIIEKNSNIQTIAIVGATGSIGQAITKILTANYPEKNYMVFARTEATLETLINQVKQKINGIKINGYLNDIESLSEADLVIVATSAAGAIIKSSHLKNNAIIYDVTQPQNVDKKILSERPDVAIYDGGLVIIPFLNKKLPFGLPPKTVFACFAETSLLAMEDHTESRSFIGKADLQQVNNMLVAMEKYNFYPSPLTLFKNQV